MKSITTTWTTEDVLRISGGGITTEQAERILEDELYYDIHEGCIAERIRELIVGYVRDEKLKACDYVINLILADRVGERTTELK